MKPRWLLLGFLALLSVVALLAACGGGSERPAEGRLTDPRDAPTATPWPQPPEVTFLDPSILTPTAPSGEPAAEGTPAASSECTGNKYIVQSGDVPSAIAEKCGVTTQALLDANPGIDPHNIHAGDELVIPR